MNNLILVLAWITFLNTACQMGNKNNPSSNPTVAGTGDTISLPANNDTGNEQPGIIRAKGLLKSIEDGGYPFITLTVEFPDKKPELSFTLNLEETKDIDPSDLYKSKGKYLDFSYTPQIIYALLDLRDKNKTILDGDDEPQKAVLKQVTGVLSAADKETLGDLPDTLSITTAENQKLDFEFFITSGMVKYNGKIVTAFYEERTNNKIVELKILP